MLLLLSLYQVLRVKVLKIYTFNNLVELPYLASVREIVLIESTFPEPIHANYLSQLQRLSLIRCGINDVSMLGRISDLTLGECYQISDISSLNHNQRIQVYNCDLVRDFSRSFEYSEEINITSRSDGENIIDFTQWKHCKILTLNFFNRDSVRFLKDVKKIPLTVQRCSLNGSALTEELDLSITSLPNLRELSISDGDLMSFHGIGSELSRVRNIELRHVVLDRLSSLSGLGARHNQRVSLSFCPFIVDFSLLRYLHTAKIETRGSVTLSELDHVHSLSITATELFVNISDSYPHIRELDVSTCDRISNLSHLIRIRSLILTARQANTFLPLLHRGNPDFCLKVQVRDLILDGPTAESRIRSLYEQYCSQWYNYETKTVWIPQYDDLIELDGKARFSITATLLRKLSL